MHPGGHEVNQVDDWVALADGVDRGHGNAEERLRVGEERLHLAVSPESGDRQVSDGAACRRCDRRGMTSAFLSLECARNGRRFCERMKIDRISICKV